MIHLFEFHIAAHYFPSIRVVSPFYATVRYSVKDNEVDKVSLEFSEVALRHITGISQIVEEAREAATQNAIGAGLITVADDIPKELFTQLIN